MTNIISNLADGCVSLVGVKGIGHMDNNIVRINKKIANLHKQLAVENRKHELITDRIIKLIIGYEKQKRGLQEGCKGAQ